MPGPLDLPDVLPLNGADYFLLTLERIMRRTSGRRNVCRIKLELDAPVDEAALRGHPLFQYLARLRLRGAGWGLRARWVLAEPGEVFRDEARDLDPARQPPIQMTVTGPCLLFSWHHALTDAHGAELLLRILGGSLELDERVRLIGPPSNPREALPRRGEAMGIKEVLDETAGFPFASLFRKQRGRPGMHHQTRFLDEAGTQIADRRSAECGAPSNRSLFYLAVVARVVHRIRLKRGLPPEDISLPMPQDQRRRGGIGPVLGNQVTFLFYRIPAAMLEELPAIVQELGRQSMQQMREQVPRRYADLMSISRYLPRALYQQVVTRPSGGRMASFFFSDTGDSLDHLHTFQGGRVKEVQHQPPNMYPPGLTFVFSRRLDRLQFTITWADLQVSDAEMEALSEAMCRSLTGADDAA